MKTQEGMEEEIQTFFNTSLMEVSGSLLPWPLYYPGYTSK
jgi:hypothetical protein